jgi:polyhydroxyalkanoate synthesis regulator phasin
MGDMAARALGAAPMGANEMQAVQAQQKQTKDKQNILSSAMNEINILVESGKLTPERASVYIRDLKSGVADPKQTIMDARKEASSQTEEGMKRAVINVTTAQFSGAADPVDTLNKRIEILSRMVSKNPYASQAIQELEKRREELSITQADINLKGAQTSQTRAATNETNVDIAIKKDALTNAALKHNLTQAQINQIDSNIKINNLEAKEAQQRMDAEARRLKTEDQNHTGQTTSLAQYINSLSDMPTDMRAFYIRQVASKGLTSKEVYDMTKPLTEVEKADIAYKQAQTKKITDEIGIEGSNIIPSKERSAYLNSLGKYDLMQESVLGFLETGDVKKLMFKGSNETYKLEDRPSFINAIEKDTELQIPQQAKLDFMKNGNIKALQDSLTIEDKSIPILNNFYTQSVAVMDDASKKRLLDLESNIINDPNLTPKQLAKAKYDAVNQVQQEASDRKMEKSLSNHTALKTNIEAIQNSIKTAYYKDPTDITKGSKIDKWTYFIADRFGWFPPSLQNEKMVYNYVNTLKSNSILESLAGLKAASPTGASGLGATNAPEINALESRIRTLDPMADTFIDDVDYIVGELTRLSEISNGLLGVAMGGNGSPINLSSGNSLTPLN